MSAIQTIQQGMTFGQMVGILNDLIVAFNERTGALDNCITDGKIDYNKIINRPRINLHVLEGSLSQSDLELSLDSETLDAIAQFSQRVNGCEAHGPRIVVLEGHRTEDRELIDGLTPYKARVETLEDHRTEDRALIDGLTPYKARVESLEQGRVADTSERLGLINSMQEKVGQAQTAASTATNAASQCSSLSTDVQSLKTTVGGQNSGLVRDVNTLKEEVGDNSAGMKKHLEQTREKTNDIITNIKEGKGLDDVAALVFD